MDLTVESYRSSDSASKATLMYLHHQHKLPGVVIDCSDDEWSIRHSEGIEIEPQSVLSFVVTKMRSHKTNAQVIITSTHIDKVLGSDNLTAHYKMAIIVPVVREDSSLKGIVCVFSKTETLNKSDADHSAIIILANMIGSLLRCEQSLLSMTAIASLYKKEADTDTLTGLLSRAGWDRVIVNEQKRITRYVDYRPAVFLIDLDDLKEVNDTMGHSAGDRLIQRCATTILGVIRESDYAARFGGDEFTLLIFECDDDGAIALEQRLLKEFGENGIRASIGYATISEERDLSSMLKEADIRMYRAKAAKKFV